MKKKFITFLVAVFISSTSQLKAGSECAENLSRNIFKFNMGFDRVIMKPIATGYNKLPDPIKKKHR